MHPFPYYRCRTLGTSHLKRYLLWATLSVVGLTVGGIMTLVWYATELPSVAYLQENYQPSLITKVYADNGQVMGQFYVERRIVTPYEKIPRHVIDAVIAVEDTRFFEHPGLDILGIVRAAWANFRRGGRFQGASTITQQLARSLFLTPERTIQRKIRELILALKMEFFLEKKHILEMYLNQIYFGRGAYGVGTAALTYFDKELAELNLAESAFLAGLPKAPSAYSPDKNYARSKKRQEHVLDRMVQAGFITETRASEAAGIRLTFQHQSLEPIAPYFLEDVRQHLAKAYGAAMVYKGGLQVSTTLNIPMQRMAEHAIRKGLRELDKRQGWRGPLRREDPPAIRPSEPPALLPESGEIFEGTVIKVSEKEATVVVQNTLGTIALEDMLWANTRSTEDASGTEATVIPLKSAAQVVTPGDVIEVSVKSQENSRVLFHLAQTPIVEGALIAIDPRNGAIRAMVGGYNFERSQFNRAIMAVRQPGSAFKPMIYATAIRQGMTPDSRVLDAPVVYNDTKTGKIWKPENYEKRFFGLMTLREALRHSRNAATVRLLDQTGIREVIDFAHSLGIQSPLSADLALALGSSGVTLQELTSAYGVFGNNGLALAPYTIATIRDSDGQLLEHHLFEPRRVMSRKTAYLVTHMLMDVIQHGTGRRARSIGHSLAGKTGTTNSYRDAWFVGYAPHLVTGVWVGFDSMKTLGTKEHGAQAALPIWKDFMAEALAMLPSQNFLVPEGIEFAEIDHKTGTLVGTPTPGSTTEVFVEGTVPQHPAHVTADPLDFYELDQAGWDVTIQ